MKELCEARVKPEMSSNFQTTFPQMDPPPSLCQKMISWLTYIGPPPTQKSVSVRR